MKKIILLTVLTVIITLVYQAKYNFVHSNSSGAIAGVANDPYGATLNGSTYNCSSASCHHGEAVSALTSANGTVQVLNSHNQAVTSYYGDSTYQVNVTMTSGTGSQNGFESVIENAAGSAVMGSATAGTNSKSAGNGYITHNGASHTNWSYTWKAPSAGAGTLIVYTVVMNRSVATRTNQFNLTETTASSGINDLSSNQLFMFPNPATNELNISTSDFNSATVEIYSLNGMLIQQSNQKGGDKITMNISNLNAGVYLVKMISNGKTSISKLVKE